MVDDPNIKYFGKPEFYCASDIQKYCGNARRLIRPLANELRISAEELNAALRETRGHPLMLGLDVKFKAGLVSSHLVNAAEGIEATCGALIRTWLSFEKNFLAPINATVNTRRKAFDFNS